VRAISRRDFAWSGLAFGLVSTSALAEGALPRIIRPSNNMDNLRKVPAQSLYDMELGPSAYDPSQLPSAEAEVDYPITPAAITLPAEFQPQTVSVPDIAAAGTIVVDPLQHFLYLVNGDGTAWRYGVGVGREGFAWSGRAVIGMKRRWPRWVPPRDMVERDAKARKWANGQPGGPDNPLGARALYLYQDGQDTLYRIHGTNQPNSIGKSMSSGCIRMLNEHVADLYDKVQVGTAVLVLSAEDPVVVQASG
jgi:lipoprotein-anchoring transpeptidase ErfK/SrfK